MKLARHAPLAISIFLLGAIAAQSAFAQADNVDKWNLKPLLPPLLAPLPPNALVTPGTVGGATLPGANNQLQNPRDRDQPAPGMRLTIPTSR
jgi:hypothetical protein